MKAKINFKGEKSRTVSRHEAVQNNGVYERLNDNPIYYKYLIVIDHMMFTQNRGSNNLEFISNTDNSGVYDRFMPIEADSIKIVF